MNRVERQHKRSKGKMSVICNKGEPFRFGKIREDGKEVDVIWINTCDPIFMKLDSFQLTRFKKMEKTDMDVHFPISEKAITEVEKNTGGLGSHLRWEFIHVPKKYFDEDIPILAKYKDDAKLDLFCIYNPSIKILEKKRKDEFTSYCVMIVKGNLVSHVCSTLQSMDIEVDTYHEEHRDTSLISLEKLDRASHMWVDQSKTDDMDVGPVRDGHHWDLSFLERSVFNWSQLCNLLEKEDDLDKYPLPLRTHMKDRLLKDLKLGLKCVGKKKRRLIKTCFDTLRSDSVDENRVVTTKSKAYKLSSMETMLLRRIERYRRDDFTFTNNLTKDQMRQMYSAFYTYKISPSDDRMKSYAIGIMRAYLLHGYLPRVIAKYTPSAQHVGFGKDLRPMKNELYMKENLPIRSKNRVYREVGEWKGVGCRGYTGKYETPNGEKKYEPHSRRRRVTEEEVMTKQFNIIVPVEESTLVPSSQAEEYTWMRCTTSTYQT